MRLDTGLLDRLFGKKVKVEVPRPDGTVREVRASQRWLEDMQRRGVIRPASVQKIRAHVLDPSGNEGLVLGDDIEDLGVSHPSRRYRTEEWTVGNDVSEAQCAQFRDPETQDLYVIVVYEGGEPRRHLVTREVWVKARAVLGVP